MKPFDLELAKKNHPIQTRNGKPARIICYDADNKSHPLVVLIRDHYHNTEVPELYTVEGKLRETLEDRDSDLVMAPTLKSGWVNIYRSSTGGVYTEQEKVYPTEEQAMEGKYDRTCNRVYLASKKIDWEE